MEFKQIFFGGDYNPEQWPEELWLEDVKLMQDAGVNLVSLGIFSWAKLEPQAGIFNFDWLDRIINLLFENGISVNLATPTAAPPAWMIKQYPDILPVTAEGITLGFGSRRHYCPHNPNYHHFARGITRALAERYQKHPALTMWHVDNEYACHFGECFCHHSENAFREWLKQRYTSLERLNAAWGTTFWGQIYGDWDEIQAPKTSPTQKNPTQQLDWSRFNSDSWLACFEEQKTILRELTPDLPITTNFMSFHRPIDYFKFAKSEDVVSLDNYPDPSQPDWMVHSAMTYDLVRSLKIDTPWILMEQAASLVNWRQRNAVKTPGQMRLGSLQAIARGANGIMFFQWRQSKAGGEKFHSAMLPHGGTDTRVWREVKALGNELPRMNNLLTGKVQAKVAFLMDWENWWALELDSKPSADLKLLPTLKKMYAAFYRQNITVDFSSPENDLSPYQLVIAPHLYLVSDTAVTNLTSYVSNGGTLLMNYFSGIVDENEQVRLGGYPAPFQSLLGLVIDEFVPFQEEQFNIIKTRDGKLFRSTFWADVIRPRGAETLATYQDDYFQGSPAITRHPFGKGIVYYLGTEPDSTGLAWLLENVLHDANLQPLIPTCPPGVEIIQRSDGNKEWLFLFNHNEVSVHVPLRENGFDLITQREVKETVQLPPSAICVIERGK